MNENKKQAAYVSEPAVAAMNKTDGFDPRKYIRMAPGGGLVLDLKFKKLWFRVIHPSGHVKMTRVALTEKVAIFEAQVFLGKDDALPVSTFTATKYAEGREGKLYIEAAQYEAQDQALNDAGFGIQFCDVSSGTAMDRLVASGKISVGTSVKPKAVQFPASAKPTPVAQPVAAAQPIKAEPLVKAANPAPAEVEPPAADPAPAAAAPAAEQAPAAAEAPKTEPAPVAAAEPEAEPAPEISEAPAAEPVAEAPAVEQDPEVSAAPAADPAAPAPVQEDGADDTAGHPPYQRDTDVGVILATMTREDALSVIVDIGVCDGKTLGEVLEERAASLRWYMEGYRGDNNILRAGATILWKEYSGEAA